MSIGAPFGTAPSNRTTPATVVAPGEGDEAGRVAGAGVDVATGGGGPPPHAAIVKAAEASNAKSLIMPSLYKAAICSQSAARELPDAAATRVPE
jgi:hypothetical protein